MKWNLKKIIYSFCVAWYQMTHGLVVRATVLADGMHNIKITADVLGPLDI